VCFSRIDTGTPNKGDLLTSIGKSKKSNKKWVTDKTIEFMTAPKKGTYFTSQSFLDGAKHKG
jgi:hypothetical protein